MTDVEIEYCVTCGYLDRAQTVQSALLDTYGDRIDRVALVTGDGGVFRVTVDGDLVFDKAEHTYDLDGIVDSVGERTSTTP